MSFHLAIEVLLISSSSNFYCWQLRIRGFHLAIEVLLISRLLRNYHRRDKPHVSISQSRFFWFQAMVEEVEEFKSFEFPSRNRGSFGFKQTYILNSGHIHYRGFHLAIEVLLVSSSDMAITTSNITICFNLVIEVLLISRLL